MEVRFTKLTSMLIAIALLSACSSTHDRSSVNQPTESNQSESIDTPVQVSQRDPFAFEKQDLNKVQLLENKALKLAVSENKIKSSHVDQAMSLTKDKVKIARYTFGFNNPIYVTDFKNALLFDHNKSVINRKDVGALRSFAHVYDSQALGKYLYVVGHTDSDGSENYNYSLSTRRAQAVVDTLIAGGISSNKLKVIPAGEHIPKVSNKTRSGKKTNRRVEVISSDSRALIESYLRQIKCPANEQCSRKLLNIYDVRVVNREAELDIDKVSHIATFSPEINQLPELHKALLSGSAAQEKKLLNMNDQRKLMEMGHSKRGFSIKRQIRPVLRLIQDRRKGFTIPNGYIIK
ncbi:OmpA family protein [Psychrobium sp. nBUS_13]|uniref:OmpA family protein n=1 Tax=Psychrobium sp. nBUS_13 TaxID=3395319 RepID=UPI003EBC5F34